MGTGKVEYAPDYKSDKPTRRNARQLIESAQRIWDESEAAKERARLEREVIEAATLMRKAERAADEGRNTLVRTDAVIECSKHRQRLQAAVDALMDFESSQQQISE